MSDVVLQMDGAWGDKGFERERGGLEMKTDAVQEGGRQCARRSTQEVRRGRQQHSAFTTVSAFE